MNQLILEAIKKGELVLFLGAGASYGCLTQTTERHPVPMPSKLAELLAGAATLPYSGEPLDVVYEATRQKLGNRLDAILETYYKNVIPSTDYERLARRVWRRIYTLNIDDGLDTALVRLSPQRLNKKLARDAIVDRNVFFKALEYVKLNGSADRLGDGIIFSPSEYARATTAGLPWYSQCASDFVRSPVLFIGTSLSEPLFKYHVERYQRLNPHRLGTSFLIAKEATEIQIEALKRYQIEYIQGTMTDFLDWVEREIPAAPSPMDVAHESIPELRGLLTSDRKEEFAELFSNVTAIKPAMVAPKIGGGRTIKEFYKGFKPTWDDVAAAVPAELEILGVAKQRILASDPNQPTLIPVIGPAGSGKTTVLMQLCWHFCHQQDWSVYFIDDIPASLMDTLVAIEQNATTDKVLVAIDDLGFSTELMRFALASGRLKKTVIISAERENIWTRRVKKELDGLTQDPVVVREFTLADAERILEKLEAYGSWTRLGKMRAGERVRELVDRAKKQLLIALLEATLGRGFERTIEDEYAKITEDEERTFLTVVAITTDRRCAAPVSLVDRALDKMSILRNAGAFANDLAGIVHLKKDSLTARHPVYAKYLVERVIDPTIVARAINGLLQAFADYKAPVIQNTTRSEAVLYKSIINHRFMFEAMKGKKNLILPTFKDLEKQFERDGLFWLQYGLALRDFDEDSEALEKLQIAYEAYPMPHTQHALAQQLLHVASQDGDVARAMGLADQARTMLESLDDIIDSDDTYPIVTLGEGYTTVLRYQASPDEARDFARKFSIVLGQRVKANPGKERLRVAYERLFKFASTGNWVEQSN